MKTWHYTGMVTLLMLLDLGLSPRQGQAAMVKLSLEQLATRADTIVLGTVTRQTSAWNAQHTAIYTEVTVAVEQVIMGASGAEVTLRIAGGVVGEIAMRSSNHPVFQDDERVIVFLDTRQVPASLVGLYQGKYSVSDGAVTWDEKTLPLEVFIEAIRTAVR